MACGQNRAGEAGSRIEPCEWRSYKSPLKWAQGSCGRGGPLLPDPVNGAKGERSLMRMKPTREEIQRRAFQIYMARGRQNGNDLADWLAAEKELLLEMSVATSSDGKVRVASRTRLPDRPSC
jgi:hypothetical protein